MIINIKNKRAIKISYGSSVTTPLTQLYYPCHTKIHQNKDNYVYSLRMRA